MDKVSHMKPGTCSYYYDNNINKKTNKLYRNYNLLDLLNQFSVDLDYINQMKKQLTIDVIYVAFYFHENNRCTKLLFIKSERNLLFDTYSDIKHTGYAYLYRYMTYVYIVHPDIFLNIEFEYIPTYHPELTQSLITKEFIDNLKLKQYTPTCDHQIKKFMREYDIKLIRIAKEILEFI